MAFDACEHKISQIIIKAGRAFRRIQGLPEEQNITNLYLEAIRLLEIPPQRLTTGKDGDHLPTVSESLAEKGIRIKCPKCQEDTYQIFSLCRGCQESEEGRYKTKLECSTCNHSEKSEKHMVLWLNELGIDFTTQSKQSLGIKTITDDGIK